MQHLAIMKPQWGFLPKILAGQKTIESRWYLNRSAPWDKISIGDSVYFKDSGQPVSARAFVSNVIQFADLAPARVKGILDQFGAADGISKSEIPVFYERFKTKRYCTLIFLKQAHEIEPFDIDKTGFGSQAAWITAPSIRALRIQSSST